MAKLVNISLLGFFLSILTACSSPEQVTVTPPIAPPVVEPTSEPVVIAEEAKPVAIEKELPPEPEYPEDFGEEIAVRLEADSMIYANYWREFLKSEDGLKSATDEQLIKMTSLTCTYGDRTIDLKQARQFFFPLYVSFVSKPRTDITFNEKLGLPQPKININPDTLDDALNLVIEKAVSIHCPYQRLQRYTK